MNCSNDVPTARDFFTNLPSLEFGGLIVCMVLSGCLILIFCEELFRIIKRPHEVEEIELFYPVWLLALYPVTGVTSVLSLCIPRTMVINRLVSAMYLSISMVKFVDLMIQYMGGRKKCLEKMSNDTISLRNPPLCCCCFCCPNVPLNRTNLRRIYIMINQNVLLRPLLLYLLTLMMLDGRVRVSQFDQTEKSYNFVSYFNTASSLLAMWGLLMIFRSVRKHLKPQGITGKFICMQLVILFINVQGPLLSAVQHIGWLGCYPGLLDNESRSQNIHNVMLIAEMLMLSGMARIWYFRPVQMEDDDIIEDTTTQNNSAQNNDLTEKDPLLQKDDRSFIL